MGRALLAAAFGLGSLVPPGARAGVARVAGALQFRLARGRREAALDNLRAIAPSGDPRLHDEEGRIRVARSMLESYAWFLLEFFSRRPPRASAADLALELRGTERLYGALAQGCGAVFVLPHTGNWELAASAMAQLGFHLHVVTGVQFHGLVTRAVRALKEREGIRVSTPEDGFVPLIETLRRGGLVALLLDGDVHAATIRTSLLGAEARVPTGPAVLARRAGAPLVSGCVHRTPTGRHVLEVLGVDRPDPARPSGEDVARLTEHAAHRLGEAIAAHLEQWCIFRPMLGAPSSRKVARAT